MREKIRFYVSSHSLKEEMEKLKEGIKGDDKVMLGIPINLLRDAEVVEMSEDKTKKNEGEVTQYYVKDSHPAIIPQEDREMVQIEIERRKALKCSYSKKNPFLGKLICEDCGGYYGTKV